MKQGDSDQLLGGVGGRERKETSQSVVNSLESASEESYGINKEASETLVIYCADPRFRLAFQDFVRTGLGISHHTLLSLAGGVGPFVLFGPESPQAAQMVEQLRIFIPNAGIRKVVVLNHTDCKWYSKLMPDYDVSRVSDRQITDLQCFARMVQLEIADVSVHTYLAVLKKETVRFKKIPTV